MNYGAKMGLGPFLFFFDNSIVRRGDLIPKHHVENVEGANKPTKHLSQTNIM